LIESVDRRAGSVRQKLWKLVRHSVMHVTTRFLAIVTVAGAQAPFSLASIV